MMRGVVWGSRGCGTNVLSCRDQLDCLGLARQVHLIDQHYKRRERTIRFT